MTIGKNGVAQVAEGGATVSTANKSIYADKEATGAADGTSWTDAFTTFQDAVDSLEDIIIHAYTIYVRDGTKKTGTADSDVANKLHDTGEFTANTWAGRRVFNVDDGTWGVVDSRESDDQLAIVDAAGAALDLFPDGDEAYVIEPTPYREQVELNGDPASYPAHVILGTLTIAAEYYWYGDCDAQANAGEILDATADFTNVEVGDRVYVTDYNGANGRMQDYEIGTVDDVSQVGSDIVRTTLTKTPTTNWKYYIVKAEISGSDDGLNGGTARDYCFRLNTIDNIKIYGFYLTFSDSEGLYMMDSRSCNFNYNIIDACDMGIRTNGGYLDAGYNYILTSTLWCILSVRSAWVTASHCVFGGLSTYVIYASSAVIELNYFYIFDGGYGVFMTKLGSMDIFRGTIGAGVDTGIFAKLNSSCERFAVTNSATTPLNPAVSTEGSYIL